MEGEIIRAYMLEPGDVFNLGRTTYKVQKIESDVIYYSYICAGNIKWSARMETMGANSQQRILLITNKNDQNGN